MSDYTYTESFEGGTLPDGWTTSTADTSGTWSVSNNRASDGTYSLYGNEPDTGADSDIWAWYEYAPPEVHYVEFDWYYDVVNTSVNYAHLTFATNETNNDPLSQDQAVSLQIDVDPDRDDTREYGFIIGGTTIGTGTWNLGTWYRMTVRIDYPNDQFSFWHKNTKYGPFTFVSGTGLSASNHTWLGFEDSNSDVYVDNIYAYHPALEGPTVNATASMKATESLPDRADWAGAPDWERAEKDGTTVSGPTITLGPNETSGDVNTDSEPL